MLLLASAGDEPHNGAAGAPQPWRRACATAPRAVQPGNGACVVLCADFHHLFDGKATWWIWSDHTQATCGTTTGRAAAAELRAAGARRALTQKFSVCNLGPAAT